MDTRLRLNILPQPDDFTCGPTCLHAVYRYYGLDLSLGEVIAGTPRLKNGGTLAVHLACKALRRGFHARIYTYNLQIFDPTWFPYQPKRLQAKLKAQAEHKRGNRLHASTEAYMEFLELGGELRYEDLSRSLIRRYLNQETPVLTGLSATYLYAQAREYGPNDDFDDIRGEPSGHFVVLCGYDRENRTVLVADPLHPNPMGNKQYYEVSMDRLISAVLLGVLTYDANLLIIQPKGRKAHTHEDPRRSE